MFMFLKYRIYGGISYILFQKYEKNLRICFDVLKKAVSLQWLKKWKYETDTIA